MSVKIPYAGYETEAANRPKTVPLGANRVQHLVALWGTQTALAADIGVDNATVHRWLHGHKKQPPGTIPQGYHMRIIEAAERRGIARSALAGVLPPDECPCCGQVLPAVSA